MRKRPVSAGVLSGLALALGLILVIGVLSVRSTTIQRDTALWVSHTQQVRLALEQLLRSIVEAQNGRRGYVIAKDETFLPPYENAVARIGTTYASLAVLTIDNPRQQQRLHAVRPMLDTQIGYLRQSLAWVRGGRSDPGAQAALTQSSREIFAKISLVVTEMSAEESALLGEREAQARASAENSRVMTLAGSVAAVIVLLAVIAKMYADGVALRRSEEERDRYFTLSADLMCVAGADGYFKRLNPAWERTLGWTVEELMSRPFLDFVHPDDRTSTNDESARANASHRVSSFKNRYRRKDGTYRWLSWTSPGMGAGSKEIYAAARDITEEILAEERITVLNTELLGQASALAASNSELEAFCYSVSHDLRAPLRAIGGFAQILTDESGAALDPEGLRLLGLIGHNARRMGQLIDDLLSFSRMGRQAMRRSPTAMHEMVETLARDMTESAAPRRIIVTIGDLPEAPADAAMVRQVWINLLSNAVKYTRDRETARIEVTGRIEDGHAVYSVRDNGVGVDMRYAHKLFAIFQRLHSTEEFEGTGVGLALVQRIVQRHGGRVSVDGRPDEEAIFTFTLPLEHEGEARSAPEREHREEPVHV